MFVQHLIQGDLCVVKGQCRNDVKTLLINVGISLVVGRPVEGSGSEEEKVSQG